MYLHLSPDTVIPILDIVTILQYPRKEGAALLRCFRLPLHPVDASSEAEWRSLVITGDCVYALPLTYETMLRRYQKCLRYLDEG